MLGHGGHDRLPEPKCGLSVAGDQLYEFVSPYATDHIKGANHVGQIIRDDFQQFLSGVSSRSAIEALEAIQNQLHIATCRPILDTPSAKRTCEKPITIRLC